MKNEPTSNKSATDWERIEALRDEEIDLSDSPEITPEMFAKAVVRRRPGTRVDNQIVSPVPISCRRKL